MKMIKSYLFCLIPVLFSPEEQLPLSYKIKLINKNQIELKFHNNSSKSYLISNPNCHTNTYFELLRNNKELSAKSRINAICNYPTYEVKPNDSLKMVYRFTIDQIFDLHESGIYELTSEYVGVVKSQVDGQNLNESHLKSNILIWRIEK